MDFSRGAEFPAGFSLKSSGLDRRPRQHTEGQATCRDFRRLLREMSPCEASSETWMATALLLAIRGRSIWQTERRGQNPALNHSGSRFYRGLCAGGG
jgi:hypothetical protein